MKILMVHPHDLFNSAEPWTRRIKSIAEEFLKNSHKVKLCYFPQKTNQVFFPEKMAPIDLIALERAPSPKALVLNTIKLIKLCQWADLVHFQKCHHYAAIPTVVAAYFQRKPLHYDWDDWEEMIWYESCGKSLHSRFIGFSFKVLERFLPVLVDTVSVSSEHLRDLAIKFGVKPENIFSAPVGADLEEFNPQKNGDHIRKKYDIKTPLVLYVGQLHGAQYIDLFIKAANIVLHKIPRVTFMIVGEGVMEPLLRSLAFELGISDKVIFTGSISHNKISEYVAAADVCVAAFKNTEVTQCKSPLKIVEYMASGKAIVASNVGEVRRMLGGVAILTKTDNAHSLAEGISRLLLDKSLRESLGRFARQRVERSYNWGRTASSLLSAYYKASFK